MATPLSQQLDQRLAKLAWSLWTELGIAGLKREHQSVSISPEELILLTATLGEFDPRLRNEALDWCSRYYRYISTTRLRNLGKDYPLGVQESLSLFCSTLNAIAPTHWPSANLKPLKCQLSGKSKLREFSSSSMLYFRLRALFGVTARADVLLYFLRDNNANFSIAEVTEIGYTKRHLTEVLQDFADAGLFEVRRTGNQLRYSWQQRKELTNLLGSLPQHIPQWHSLFKILLSLRECVQRAETQSIGSKIVEVRNSLKQLEDTISRLGLKPPPIRNDLKIYWDNFSVWLLDIVSAGNG